MCCWQPDIMVNTPFPCKACSSITWFWVTFGSGRRGSSPSSLLHVSRLGVFKKPSLQNWWLAFQNDYCEKRIPSYATVLRHWPPPVVLPHTATHPVLEASVWTVMSGLLVCTWLYALCTESHLHFISARAESGNVIGLSKLPFWNCKALVLSMSMFL